MSTEKNTQKKSYWGSSRFGGSSRRLIVTCILAGIPLSLLAGGLITLLQPGHPRADLMFIIGAAVTLPVCCIAVWAFLVDRSTMTGAPEDPESSIEGQWLYRAAASSFMDLFAIIGLSTAVFTFVDVPISTAVAFGGLAVVALLDFGLRYLIIKRREG